LKEGDGLTIHHVEEEILLTPACGTLSRSNPQPPPQEPMPDFELSEDSCQVEVSNSAKGVAVIPQPP
jgi:hypothetical protein